MARPVGPLESSGFGKDSSPGTPDIPNLPRLPRVCPCPRDTELRCSKGGFL